MFQYRQGRCYVPGASVAIPDSFFFDTDPENFTSECVALYSPAEDYGLVFSVYDMEGETDAALFSILSDCESYKIFQPVSPIFINGLAGHYAVYASLRNSYFEARFQLNGDRQLVVLVQTEDNSSIQGIVASDVFKAVLAGIRAEDK